MDRGARFSGKGVYVGKAARGSGPVKAPGAAFKRVMPADTDVEQEEMR